MCMRVTVALHMNDCVRGRVVAYELVVQEVGVSNMNELCNSGCGIGTHLLNFLHSSFQLGLSPSFDAINKGS